MTRLRRAVKRTVAAIAILIAAGFTAAWLVVQSGWFREQVRGRLVTALETATGARVELGSFSFDWHNLSATVSPLVLHGREPAGEPPLLRVESVALELRVISALERKIDLAALRVYRPRVRIAFYADGSDNLPSPNRPDLAVLTRSLLDLAVRQYEFNDGLIEVDQRQAPFNLRGEDLRLALAYQPKGPHYQGTFSAQRIRFASKDIQPVELGAAGDFSLDQSKLNVSRLRMQAAHSSAELSGSFVNLHAPQGNFNTKVTVALQDAVPLFQLPLERSGSASFDGKFAISFAPRLDYKLSGRLSARGIGYTGERLTIENGDVRADLVVTPEQIHATSISAAAPGIVVRGAANLNHRRDLQFDGTFEGLDLRQTVQRFANRSVPWSGSLGGTVQFGATLGQRDAKVSVAAAITPGPEGTPLEGRIELNYDQASGTVRFGDSSAVTPFSTLDLSGTLGQLLNVKLHSTNLDDFAPALAMFQEARPEKDAPKSLPLVLGQGSSRGEASLEGTVSGQWEEMHFRGKTSVLHAAVDGHAFDRFSSDLDASRQALVFRRLTLVRGATEISGETELTARSGDLTKNFSQAALGARLTLRNASLGPLAKEFSQQTGFTGSIAGTAAVGIRLAGSLQHPEGDITLDIEKLSAYGQSADRLKASVHYASSAIRVSGGEADLGMGRLLFAGVFERASTVEPAAKDDWRTGNLHLDLNPEGVRLSRFTAVSHLPADLDAQLSGRGSIDGRLAPSGFTLTAVNGNWTAREITLGPESVGDANLDAKSQSGQLALQASAKVQGTDFSADGTWKLEGDLPGSFVVRFPRLSIEALHDLVMIGATTAQRTVMPPFEAFIEGGARFNLSLLKPESFQGQIDVGTLQINAKPSQALQLGAQASDLVLRNTRPAVIDVSAKGARLQPLTFTGRDTSLEASGTLPFDAKTGADLAVRGNINLTVLQLVNPDLLARGSASVAASVRGSLRDPQLNGRMELKQASLYLNDVANGVDNANGVVLFDRNRATIDKLTAETGGGRVSMGGFLEFGEPLIYRLQADVQQVRVRYPTDISITGNAQLALNGTSQASTLSGSLTLIRAAIDPRADLGQLLANAAKPAPAPANGNDYLRGVRFDVHIESSPAFELQTSLTRNVQSEVDLRLRGTPRQPSLLGNISVNAGEVQVFGNSYTVNRGEVRFINPARIEPNLDVNLETKARGVTVNISISGTAQKLNVNYSSDPPLQARDIIALLAVGRDPTLSSLTDSQVTSNSTSFSQAAGGLLGQAVSEQLSSRLQRFLGTSRVKIDPTLDNVTGTTALPEARLTFEQGISRDITLTYITNLNRTQEQIVQIQWDLNRQWSAIATRDSNGLFGIDFQYKKRFK